MHARSVQPCGFALHKECQVSFAADRPRVKATSDSRRREGSCLAGHRVHQPLLAHGQKGQQGPQAACIHNGLPAGFVARGQVAQHDRSQLGCYLARLIL